MVEVVDVEGLVVEVAAMVVDVAAMVVGAELLVVVELVVDVELLVVVELVVVVELLVVVELVLEDVVGKVGAAALLVVDGVVVVVVVVLFRPGGGLEGPRPAEADAPPSVVAVSNASTRSSAAAATRRWILGLDVAETCTRNHRRPLSVEKFRFRQEVQESLKSPTRTFLPRPTRWKQR